MSSLDPLFFPLFLVSLLVWAGLSIYVLLDRLVFDLRQRNLRRALVELKSAGLEALGDEAMSRQVDSVLDRLPGPAQDRLIADPRVPPFVVEAFTAGLLARRGMARLLKDAEGPARGRKKWKRISALVVLARIRHESTHTALAKALEDPDPDLAGTAVALAGLMRDQAAAQLLIAALARGAIPASRIATQLDQFPDWIIPMLLPLLEDDSPTVRYWGANLLGRFTERVELAAALVERSTDSDPAVRKVAVQALGGFPGSASVGAALNLLEDSAPFVRAHALRALGEIGEPGAGARMAKALGDPDWWVRLAAKEALVAMGVDVWEDVARQLDSADRFARNGASEVLQNLGLLERWIEEALRDPAGPSVQHLVRVVRAGGQGMYQATLDLPEQGDRERLAALLEQHGLGANGPPP